MVDEHCDIEPETNFPKDVNDGNWGPIIAFLLRIYRPLRAKDTDRTLTEFIACMWLCLAMFVVGLVSVVVVIGVVAPTFPLWYPFYCLGGKIAAKMYGPLLDQGGRDDSIRN